MISLQKIIDEATEYQQENRWPKEKYYKKILKENLDSDFLLQLLDLLVPEEKLVPDYKKPEVLLRNAEQEIKLLRQEIDYLIKDKLSHLDYWSVRSELLTKRQNEIQDT
jgi:hypothetical protein